MERMALDADGAQVRGHRRHRPGAVPRTPPITVTSQHQLPRTRAIFYAKDEFSLHGEGDFAGTVRMYKGGYEVKGDFVSPEAGYDDYRFQDFRAAVVWVPTRLDVTRGHGRSSTAATADFTYVLEPLGRPGRRADARWDVPLHATSTSTTFTDFLETRGMRLAGARHRPHSSRCGRSARRLRRGHRRGHAAGRDAAGARAGRARRCPTTPSTAPRRRAEEQGPFSPHIAFGPVPVAGAGELRLRRRRPCASRRASFATRRDLRRLRGPHRLGPGLAPAVPRDQHRLAGERPLPGRHHDDVRADAHRRRAGRRRRRVRRRARSARSAIPRVEGTFTGQRDARLERDLGRARGRGGDRERLRARDQGGRHATGDARLDVDGQFALGYPRRDGGEEIDARIRATEWPLTDLRTAFELYDYPVDRRARRRDPSLRQVRRAVRLRPPHARPRRGLRRAVRLGRDQPALRGRRACGSTGSRCRRPAPPSPAPPTSAGTAPTRSTPTAAAWPSTRSTSPISPTLPALTGFADFSAAGSGTFEEPRYDVKVSVFDLFIGDEGIGEMTAQVALRGLTGALQLRRRLAAPGGLGHRPVRAHRGRRDRDDGAAVGHLARSRMRASSCRRSRPTPRPPAAAACASGARSTRPNALHVEAADRRPAPAALRLRAAQPRRAARRARRPDRARRRLRDDRRPHGARRQRPRRPRARRRDAAGQRRGQPGRAAGRAAPTCAGSGRAEVSAHDRRHHRARPPCRATRCVTDGRLRSFAFPHALEAINGIVTFDATSVRLDGLRASLADGSVHVRRPPGPARPGPGRLRRDPHRPRPAPALSRGHAVARRRRAHGAGPGRRAGAGRVGAGALGRVDAAASTAPPTCSARRRRHGAAGRARPCPARSRRRPRWRCATTCGLWRRPPSASRTTWRASSPAPMSTCAAPTTGRWCSAAPTSSAARCASRAAATSCRAAASTSPTPSASSRSSTSRPRPACGCPARPTGSRCAWPARPSGCSRSSPPTRRCRRPTCCRCCWPTRTPAGDVEVASLRSPNQREQELLQARATRALTGALSAEVGKVVQDTFGVDTFQITPLLVDPVPAGRRA